MHLLRNTLFVLLALIFFHHDLVSLVYIMFLHNVKNNSLKSQEIEIIP